MINEHIQILPACGEVAAASRLTEGAFGRYAVLADNPHHRFAVPSPRVGRI